LLGDTLPYFLGGSGVTNERDSHLKTFRRNITNGGLDIVRDPLNEVRRVFIDNVKHLLIDLLSGHSTSEHISTSQVSAVSRISSTHHVLGIEGLLGELGNSKSSVLLRASGCKWSKSNHEKVKTWERDHVDGKLSEIAVQLTRETKGASCTTDGSRHQVVKITICRGGELKSSKANIVEGLVIKSKTLISILDKLMDRKGTVIWLNDGIRHLRRRNDGVCRHNSIRVLLSDLGDKKST
jgi:hypothetical protein